MFSLCLCWFPPTLQRHAVELNADSKLPVGVSMKGCLSLCQSFDRLATCLLCATPLAQWQLGSAPASPTALDRIKGICNGWIDLLNRYVQICSMHMEYPKHQAAWFLIPDILVWDEAHINKGRTCKLCRSVENAQIKLKWLTTEAQLIPAMDS